LRWPGRLSPSTWCNATSSWLTPSAWDLTIGGVAMIVAVVANRIRMPAGWQRYGVPLLLGLGSGMALLEGQPRLDNSAFFAVFRSSEGPGMDLARYLGFTAGASTTVRQVAGLAAAAALLVAGVAVAGSAGDYVF
jgi:hypothetical protein